MEAENLKLWESVEKTDPKTTKPAKIGQLNITAINATSQIKEATRHFGSFGGKWGLKNLSYEYMDVGETKLALVGAVFYYPDGEFPLHTSIKVTFVTNGGKGYLKIDDDFMKKAETDLITKSLSRLGFNADIFMGRYDDNRYVEEMKAEFNKPKLINVVTIGELAKLVDNKGLNLMAVLSAWSLKNLGELQTQSIPAFKAWVNNAK